VGTDNDSLSDVQSSDHTTQQANKGHFLRLIGLLGELLITAGAVCLLFAVYQLWWTNVESAQQTNKARAEVQELFDNARKVTKGGTDTVPKVGKAFGFLYIPRLRDHVWKTPLIEGTERPQLARGIGHYVKTAMPGQIGNFAIAGHRATHGEPFANFDQLKAGDKVFVETVDGWFTYQLMRDEIVRPQDVWTISVQPLTVDPLPSNRLITLTTCNPRWASTQRWAFWGMLIGFGSRAEGPPKEVDE